LVLFILINLINFREFEKYNNSADIGLKRGGGITPQNLTLTELAQEKVKKLN
jgi:hypothetical protein